MRYFASYINIDNVSQDSYHKLIYDNQDEITNNRAIPGDMVLVSNNQVINILKRTSVPIYGLVDVDLSRVYKVDKRGRKYYKFYPEDKRYPVFLVAVNSVKYRQSVLVNITFRDWNTDSKLPTGSIRHIYGYVGELSSEIQYRIAKDNLYVKPKLETFNLEQVALPNRNFLLEDYYIFSIDPPGSRDIDDALHLCKLENGNWELGIHIADPTQYYDPLISQISTSSLYLPHTQLPMLGGEITYNMASLIAGKERSTVSLILHFNPDGKLIDSEIVSGKVNLVRNFSYDDANYKIKHKHNSRLVDALSGICNILHLPHNSDSTQIVAHCMILSNCEVAKYLTKHRSVTILRGNAKSNLDLDLELEHLPSKYKTIAQNIYTKNHIEYEISNSKTHNGLNVSKYTHFTSPIRRHLDSLVHWILKYPHIFENVDNITKLYRCVNHINIQMKKYKQLYNWIENCQLIENIVSKNTDIVVVDGYPICINETGIPFILDTHPFENRVYYFNFIQSDTRMESSVNLENELDKIKLGKPMQLTLQVIPGRFGRKSLQIVKVEF